MLRAELTSASPNKLSALTQSAVKLRPNVVARVLSNHVRQVCLIIEGESSSEMVLDAVAC